MLARLDQDLAPLRSAVNREGTLLRVHGAGDAADLRVSEIVDQLEYVAERLEAAPSVARWFGMDDVDELSQEEASVLATRWIDELGSEGVIQEPNRLMKPLTDWFLGSFRSAARTGVIEMRRIDEESLRGALDEDEVQIVRTWLERKLVGLQHE